MSVMLESGWSFKANGAIFKKGPRYSGVVLLKDENKHGYKLYYQPLSFNFSTGVAISMQEVCSKIRKAIHKKSNYTLKCK